jgi:mRNA interferase MazF
MLTSGDVVALDPGLPTGSEAGLRRAAIVVAAQQVLAGSPTVVQIVPVTRTLRGYESEVVITADDHNGLTGDSAAQCQHIRAVATATVQDTIGNVGPTSLAQIRAILAVLLDL